MKRHANVWIACVYIPQGSPLSLSRSSSREGVGNGSDSDNWRERNGTGNGLPGHAEFPSAVSSPKRKQNKSGQWSFLYRDKQAVIISQKIC